MTDDNPYRFTGGAAERVGTIHPQDPLRGLRTIALLRSLLTVALALYVSSLTLYLAALAVQGTSAPNAPEGDGYIVGLACMATCVGYASVVIFGVMLIPRACPRFSRTTTTLILMPALNVVIAFLALRESRQTLEAHGVRLGWLTCDYSQAIAVEPPGSASAA